jgi:ferredoxin/flavodoxin
MKNQPIDIYCFSGTGNTWLIASHVADTLRAQGRTVTLHRLETTDPSTINPEHVIGLACTVAMFSTYPFVWDFFHRLPTVSGTEVFMMDTLGGFSGGLLGPLKKTLQQKGFKPIGAREFLMPSNYGNRNTNAKNESIIARAKIKAEKYALDLLNGNTAWHGGGILSSIIRLISKSKKPWRFFAKTLTLDEKTCVKCGLCARLCPVKAIDFTQGQFPTHHSERCVACMRCIGFCPKQAILYRGKKLQYHAVASAEFLK